MSNSLHNFGRFVQRKAQELQAEILKKNPDTAEIKVLLSELEQDIYDIRKLLNLIESTMFVMFKDDQGEDCCYGGNSFEELVRCMKANSATPIRTFTVYEKQDFGSKVLGYITNGPGSNSRYNYIWTDFRVTPEAK